MPDIWMDVDIALTEVPVNMLALTDDTDFKTRETGITYNQAGMDLVWNFITTAGAYTQTAVTPTTAGAYDWTHQGDGMYTIEIPASGGASINNATEGFGYFTGICTGVLHWRGPTIGFRAVALNNALIDGGDTLDVNVTTIADTSQTANDNGADINDILDDVTGLNGDAMRGTDSANTTTPPTVVQIRQEMDSNSTRLADIETDTGEIGTAGAGLTNINLPNQTMDITGNLSGSVGSVTANVTTDSASRTASQANVSALALEASITELKGSGFVESTDSNEAIRNRGDIAWTTGAGGSSPTVEQIRTEMDTNSTKLIDIVADTNELQTDNIPGLIGALNNVSTAQVQASCDTAINANSDINTIITTTDKLDDTLELDGSVYRFTQNALEEAPSGTGGDATAANQTIIVNHLLGVKGTTWLESTDSLEAIRNRGDAAWITGGGASGSNTVTITIDDGTNPIQDVSVQLWNSGVSALVTYGTTDTNGQVSVTANDATYKIKIRKGGYTFSAIETLVVSGDTSATYHGTAYTPSGDGPYSPAGPGTEDTTTECAVYWYARNPDDSKGTGLIRVIPSTDTVKYKDNIKIIRKQISMYPNEATGYVEIDLIENENMTDLDGNAVTYAIYQGELKIGNISVPDQAEALLWDIIV